MRYDEHTRQAGIPTLRINAGTAKLTDRKYWHWSDVRGLSATSLVADACAQP